MSPKTIGANLSKIDWKQNLVVKGLNKERDKIFYKGNQYYDIRVTIWHEKIMSV